jgi:hypothetical protein
MITIDDTTSKPETAVTPMTPKVPQLPAPPQPRQQQPPPQYQQQQQQQQQTTPPRVSRPSSQSYQANRHSWAVPETVNVRVLLEHSTPRSPSLHRYSGSPNGNLNGNLDTVRYPSIRRRRSRSELKEYGNQQALHDAAQEILNGG